MRLSLFVILMVAAACCVAKKCAPPAKIPTEDLNKRYLGKAPACTQPNVEERTASCPSYAPNILYLRHDGEVRDTHIMTCNGRGQLKVVDFFDHSVDTITHACCVPLPQIIH